MEDDKKIVNAKYLIEDLIYGNQGIVKREDYNLLTNKELVESLKLIIDNPNLSIAKKKFLLANSWAIFYKLKPPTPSEFLSSKYLGATAESLYPHLKNIFIAFLDPAYCKNTLILSTAISFGKSTLSVLIVMYIITLCQLMRNPKKYYGVSPATSLSIVLLSFTQKQGHKLLMKPFMNLLTTSPFFIRARDEAGLYRKQEDYPDKIVYTTASKIGELQFSKDIHMMVESDRSGYLGTTLIAGICSEISFWVDRGIAPDEIWQTFTNMRQRIVSRFGNKFLTATILDSSPYDLEKSPIDKYIYTGDASKDSSNLVIHAKHWDIFCEDIDKYPVYSKTGETFPIFKGYAGKQPKILTKYELANYDKQDIFDVPVDLKKEAELNLGKILKDYCAYPSSGLDKLFQSNDSIESIFSYQLENIYKYITAPANKPPERLIFDQIKNKFFIINNGNYEFWRNHYELRYIGVDQSTSTDVTGISMLHLEMNNKGEKVCVVDFSISIIPTKDKINLDAIVSFIIELKEIGNISIGCVLFDNFNSDPSIQRLDRLGIKVKKDSVDRTLAPYVTFVSWCLNKRVKIGRNIFFKNNLRSLREVERESGTKKIEHINVSKLTYDDGADWNNSNMGFGAKDLSDSVCNPFYYAINNHAGIPCYQWEDDNEEDYKEIYKENSLIEQKKKIDVAKSKRAKELLLKRLNKDYLTIRGA